jgi:hypothetical protein
MASDEDVIEISKWQIDLLRESIEGPLEESLRNKILQDAYCVELGKPHPLISVTAFIVYGMLFLWCGIVGTYLDIAWLQPGYLAIAIVYLVYHFGIARQRWRRAVSGALLVNKIRPKKCLVCGYELRGAISEQCPECGESLAAIS